MALSRHGGTSPMAVRCGERAIAQIGKGKVVYGRCRATPTTSPGPRRREKFLDALVGTTAARR